jgi:hypothetical protein
MRTIKDSNLPGYDAVRIDILVLKFRSSFLLPLSGWYTLPKLDAAHSETLLPVHQNTQHTDNWNIQHFAPNHSRHLSLVNIRCLQVKSHCVTTFLHPL